MYSQHTSVDTSLVRPGSAQLPRCSLSTGMRGDQDWPHWTVEWWIHCTSRYITIQPACASSARHQTGVSPLKSASGGIITDDTSKATALSEYFCNVFTADDQNIPEFTRRVGDDISMSTVTFSSYSVFKTLLARQAGVWTPMAFLFRLLKSSNRRWLTR